MKNIIESYKLEKKNMILIEVEIEYILIKNINYLILVILLR